MSNSFYYFFSAVPQVLAAILALFGVFVVFKIQTIKTQLRGIGQSIIDEAQLYVNWRNNYFTSQMKAEQFINALKKAILGHDIKELQRLINIIESDHYEIYKRKYNGLYDFLESLIKNTIYWSIFTAIIIIICLTLIPLGNVILGCNFFLYPSFGLVIICLIFCFYGLISILRKSLMSQ